MEDFITGVLVQNEEGATYEGTVYDRFLQLRLKQGQVLSIFDPPVPISTNLLVNEVYQMVLAVLAISVTPAAENPSELKADEWEGTIAELDWKVPQERYRSARPSLSSRSWVLVTTSLGQLLINRKEITSPISVGERVRWENIRFDLYAVI